MPRTLTEVVESVRQHSVDYPDHGHNCTCMDEIIRELRSQVSAVLAPEVDIELKLKMRWRLSYIFSVLGRM